MRNYNPVSPLVSIFMMTYNHKNYITNAIEGILLQKTNFQIEVVIGDDFSVDGTRDILIKYKNEFPNIFKLVLHDRNIGAMNNQIITLHNCVGTYIAICEGDDYWIDEFKLQKQIDYLKKNDNCGMVFTNHYILHEYLNNKITKAKRNFDFTKIDVRNELLKHNFIGTLTTVIRASVLKNALQNIDCKNKTWPSCDTALWIEISSISEIGFINDYTAVYRMHNKSASSKSVYQKAINDTANYREMIYFFINKYNIDSSVIRHVEKQICKRYLHIALYHRDNTLAKIYSKKILNDKEILTRKDVLKYKIFYITSFFKITWYITYLIVSSTKKLRINTHRQRLNQHQ